MGNAGLSFTGDRRVGLRVGAAFICGPAHASRVAFNFRVCRAIALSSEVDAGSREENASNKNLELRF